MKREIEFNVQPVKDSAVRGLVRGGPDAMVGGGEFLLWFPLCFVPPLYVMKLTVGLHGSGSLLSYPMMLTGFWVTGGGILSGTDVVVSAIGND